MPLYPNGNSPQKKLTFTGMGTYVKENYNLYRERVTVFTKLCGDPSVTHKPEFVFKGKETRTALHPPKVNNWAPKQVLRTISNLTNKFSIFTIKN